MSWDGLIVRAPEAGSVNDLPNDFQLPPLGTTDQIGNMLRELFPEQTHHHGQCCVEGEDFWVELNFRDRSDADTRTSIGVRCNAGDGALAILAQVCSAFDARLFDNQTGDFADLDTDTRRSMQRFAKWRDGIIGVQREPGSD